VEKPIGRGHDKVFLREEVKDKSFCISLRVGMSLINLTKIDRMIISGAIYSSQSAANYLVAH